MRILAKETMALVIDVQERLLPVIYNNTELLHHVEILMKGLRALNVPMLVTQQYTKGLGMTVPQLSALCGDEFHYEEKITFSCAEDEKIIKRINESGKKNILVFGIEAHICVLQTVIDLIEKGYHVILVENCVSSRKANDRTIGIARAVAEGATLTTYEAILFELTRSAKHDAFKEISSLIK